MTASATIEARTIALANSLPGPDDVCVSHSEEILPAAVPARWCELRIAAMAKSGGVHPARRDIGLTPLAGDP